jgi:hypothetical protein
LDTLEAPDLLARLEPLLVKLETLVPPAPLDPKDSPAKRVK